MNSQLLYHLGKHKAADVFNSKRSIALTSESGKWHYMNETNLKMLRCYVGDYVFSHDSDYNPENPIHYKEDYPQKSTLQPPA